VYVCEARKEKKRWFEKKKGRRYEGARKKKEKKDGKGKGKNGRERERERERERKNERKTTAKILCSIAGEYNEIPKAKLKRKGVVFFSFVFVLRG
jgi:hypothetical protein